MPFVATFKMIQIFLNFLLSMTVKSSNFFDKTILNYYRHYCTLLHYTKIQGSCLKMRLTSPLQRAFFFNVFFFPKLAPKAYLHIRGLCECEHMYKRKVYSVLHQDSCTVFCLWLLQTFCAPSSPELNKGFTLME